MTTAILFLVAAATLVAIGMVLGTGMATYSINQRHQRVAKLMRELNERQDVTPSSGHPRGICEGCPLEF